MQIRATNRQEGAKNLCQHASLATRHQRIYLRCRQNWALKLTVVRQTVVHLLQRRNRALFQALEPTVVRIFHTATFSHLEPNRLIRVRIIHPLIFSIKTQPSLIKAIWCWRLSRSKSQPTPSPRSLTVGLNQAGLRNLVEVQNSPTPTTPLSNLHGHLPSNLQSHLKGWPIIIAVTLIHADLTVRIKSTRHIKINLFWPKINPSKTKAATVSRYTSSRRSHLGLRLYHSLRDSPWVNTVLVSHLQLPCQVVVLLTVIPRPRIQQIRKRPLW